MNDKSTHGMIATSWTWGKERLGRVKLTRATPTTHTSFRFLWRPNTGKTYPTAHPKNSHATPFQLHRLHVKSYE